MLHKIKDLQGDALHTEDGEVGSADDLYFDDEDLCRRSPSIASARSSRATSASI